jgi:hypothetical protein
VTVELRTTLEEQVKPTREEIAEAISEYMDVGELMEHNRRLSVAYLYELLKEVERKASKDASRITENTERIARAGDAFVKMRKQIAEMRKELDILKGGS